MNNDSLCIALKISMGVADFELGLPIGEMCWVLSKWFLSSSIDIRCSFSSVSAPMCCWSVFSSLRRWRVSFSRSNFSASAYDDSLLALNNSSFNLSILSLRISFLEETSLTATAFVSIFIKRWLDLCLLSVRRNSNSVILLVLWSNSLFVSRFS